MKVPHVILPAFADDDQRREPCPGRSVPKCLPGRINHLTPWDVPLVGSMQADYGILVVNSVIGSASSVLDPMQLR